jgi:Flp pilus assembly protein TadB
MPDEPVIDRDELRAAVAARQELGPDLEPQVIDAFLEKIERRVDERVKSRAPAKRDNDHAFELAIASIVAGVALAIGAMAFGPATAWVAVIGWLAIIVINRNYRRR